MVRGGATQCKVHLKGAEDDFIIMVDDSDVYKKWQEDKSTPMAHFVSAFKIFVTHKQGTQGQYDEASKAILENEFGTANVDDCIKQILEKGSIQEFTGPERQGPAKDAAKMGPVS